MNHKLIESKIKQKSKSKNQEEKISKEKIMDIFVRLTTKEKHKQSNNIKKRKENQNKWL
jgi:hypothetical protein